MTEPADKLPLRQPLAQTRAVHRDTARLLNRLGLQVAADLLFYFPRRYEDYTEILPLAQTQVGLAAQVLVTVREIDQHVSEAGKHVLYLLTEQDRRYLRVIFFNQGFLAERFRVGQRLLLRGTISERGGRIQMTQPRYQILEADQPPPAPRLLPVYGLTDGLKQRHLRQIIEVNLPDLVPLIDEALPEGLRERWNLCDIATALNQIHFPRSAAEQEAAQRRLVFQELLILQLALAWRRNQAHEVATAPAIELTPLIRDRIMGRFPFPLTESQLQVFGEIAADMGRAVPMNRLLQGDVGSGKTAVATAALLLAVAGGHQAVLMAPTEILARQHERTLASWLKNSRVRLALWTGSTSHRTQLQERIAAGEIDIVVGTQAIVQGDLNFRSLGLAVIDEQHKFGVKQRARLRNLSTQEPHYLVMTATPIPRTISMTVFGDLDISTLRQATARKATVHTYLGTEANRDKWWEFFSKKLREGRQGYVIAPLVSGDDESVAGVNQLFESLTNGPLADFRLDLLHGRQTAEEKDAALRGFALGKTQVIIATSVVEVGIDVPNATVMTIESAERFGLSQLHQLRGRVGRGQHPGFVCAFSTSDNPGDNERLQAFANSLDGFELAETDLRLRGPGNLFSTEQTGFPPLRIADLARDAELLHATREAARELIAQDPQLQQEHHSRLRQLVLARYGITLDLANVG